MKRQCFLCGKDNFKKLFVKDGCNIVKCQNCQVVISLDKNFQRPQRANMKIYSKSDYQKFYLSEEVQLMLSQRAKRRLNEIRKRTKGNKILDVGTSYGTFIKTAKRMGWQAEGVEPYKKAVDWARRNSNLTIYKGTLSSIKLNKKYNVISYWDVLEHLPNPINELKRARKYLNKDGIIAIQSPNINSLSARIAKERFGWLTPIDHLTHFSPQTLRLVLTKAGFEVLEIKTWSGDAPPFSQLVNDLFPKEKTPSLLRYPIVLSTIFLDRFLPFIGVFFNWIQSVFLVNGLIIAYARKK